LSIQKNLSSTISPVRLKLSFVTQIILLLVELVIDVSLDVAERVATMIVDLTALPHALMLLRAGDNARVWSRAVIRALTQVLLALLLRDAQSVAASAIHQLKANSTFNVLWESWVDLVGKGAPPLVDERELMLMVHADHLASLGVERVVPWLALANEVNNLNLIAELDKSWRVAVEDV